MKKYFSPINVFLLALMFVIVSVAAGSAADYPSRPITLIVPYSAGGSTDIQARMIAKHMKEKLGKPINVVNKPGGGGAVGMVAAKMAKPDGYTFILTASGPVSVTPFRTDAGYDPLKDYEYMAQLSSVYFALSVNSKSGIKTFQQWADFAAKNPAKATYATTGAGLHIHLVMVDLLGRMKLNLQHIPFNGASETVGQLLGEHVFAAMVSLPDCINHYRAGTLNTLAIASDKRHNDIPEVPTLKELGYDVSAGGWFAFMAPKGTPADIVAKLNAAIAFALEQPDVIDRYKNLGMTIKFTDPDALEKFVTGECEKHSTVLKKLKL